MTILKKMKNNSTYIIGEIGQNHNGSLELAKKIINEAAKEIKDDLFNIKLEKINAVKFTKRDLNEELSTSQMNMLYMK